MRNDPKTLRIAEEEARELGKTLVSAIASKRKDPALEAFHQRFQERFKDIISGERPKWPLDYEYWVSQAWVLVSKRNCGGISPVVQEAIKRVGKQILQKENLISIERQIHRRM